jgi:hypothetical protein
MAKSHKPNTQSKAISLTGELVKTDNEGEIELTEEDLKGIAGGAAINRGWNRIKN